MTITTTNHRSREMAISLGPQGTFVTGTKAKPVTLAQYQTRADVHLRLHYLDELRRVYFTCVSVHIGFVTGIKQRSLPQLVTGHVKWLFL
jgi:hypothetical protein